jgi:hypothetical protein
MGVNKRAGSLLTKALEKVQTLTSVPVEVLISRQKSGKSSIGGLTRLWSLGLLAEDQIVIHANPTTKRAEVWVGPKTHATLKAQDWEEWIAELEEDLHQTHPDRALALAVMSLGLALHSLHQR